MVRVLGASAILLLAVAVRAAGPETVTDPFLPPGEGRDRVAAVCTSCHAARAFAQLREGPKGWRAHVNEMILHGAQIRPDDVDPIIDYLSTAFGPGVPLQGPEPATADLPAGSGREIVAGACGLCHGLGRVAAAGRSPQEWRGVVARMIVYGAPLSPNQQQQAVQYLGRNFAPQDQIEHYQVKTRQIPTQKIKRS